jgi:signal transduction histidine kinase
MNKGLGLASVTALALAAVTVERRRAQKALQSVRDELELKVSERTAELEHRNAAEKEAREEADRSKDDFVALVSHELRTPLTSLRGYLEVLLDGDDGELNEGQRESAEIACRNAARLQELLGDLLTLSGFESDAIELQRRPVDLELLARELEQELRTTATQREIEILVAAEEGAVVYGDPHRLAQAFSNLLSNAIKFSPHGATVELRCRRENTEVVVDVTDSGVGIPAEEMARVGQRFYRASSAETVQGTGLGLAIAREILERHGGRLEIESELGVGSTFRAHIPVDQRRGSSTQTTMNREQTPPRALHVAS